MLLLFNQTLRIMCKGLLITLSHFDRVLTFRLNYMGVAQLMNSKYIKKTML